MPTIIGESPMEFFRAALGEAMASERVTVQPHTEYYIVQLLTDEVGNGHHPDETLSDVFAKALSAKPVDRARLLRSVGDRALLFTGLWWERNYRSRRVSNARFHLDIGRIAYLNIGGVPFDEMAEKFEGIVDALIRLGTDASLTTARDLLRLYLLWHETHSSHIARVLMRQGLIPCSNASRAPS